MGVGVFWAEVFFGVRVRVVTPCFYSRNIYNSLGKVADKLQHDSEF